MNNKAFIIRKCAGITVEQTSVYAFLFLRGPFEYPEWVQDSHSATQLLASKAYQLAEILDGEVVPLV